ncbi:MAG: response regulator [Chlorobiaceae bacterium]|nr:response regulator [Chlorobiaceae bacterium]
MSGKATILLVDDKVIILKICEEMLEMNGYRILSASTPSEAIEIAGKYDGNIDLLLTDVMMSSLSGVQSSRRLSSVRKGMKTLFMSGHSGTVLDEKVDSGAINLLVNPFTMKAFLDKAGAKLRQP